MASLIRKKEKHLTENISSETCFCWEHDQFKKTDITEMVAQEPNIIIIHHPKIKNKCLQDFLLLQRHIVLWGKHNNFVITRQLFAFPSDFPQCILTDGLQHWPVLILSS